VNPTTPCSPASRPVPSEQRLIGVLEGTPAVTTMPPLAEERGGRRSVLDKEVVAQAVDEEKADARRARQGDPRLRARRR
jgi:hypothetical protein